LLASPLFHDSRLQMNRWNANSAALAFTLLLASLVEAKAGHPFTGYGPLMFQDDIGSPQIAGSATYDVTNQDYTISSAGTNMWFGRDQFHFAWIKMDGNFILRTRIRFIGSGGDAHRKAGWMVRPNLDADAPYADCVEHGDGLTSLQFRRSKGANTEQVTLNVTNADVLQFERHGSNFIFSAARFGEPFRSCELTNLDLGDKVFTGLFVCSHNGRRTEQAIFDDVRVIKPAKDDFIPYHDYLGSMLEVLDADTGNLKLIYSCRPPFEAPNWTREENFVIYNQSGPGNASGLTRFDLEHESCHSIDTFFATRLNNDHVLSFDGKTLGISDQSKYYGDGKSCILTLPATGGRPKKITPLTPSYLHGWSPDGKWLVYTGARNNKFDIYKIRSSGEGDEIRLTTSEGLNDGPEFTPDGQFIYFNSSRSGKMQIWRMKPDGTNQEQVTDDEFNNWFPHISPDSKRIVFLSYPPSVRPEEHPYYKQVYLRLMPLSGGSAKVVAYVYGGQGTMNVPSWSPDSRRIAFVSNCDFSHFSPIIMSPQKRGS
jgi:hypothetical protein